MKKTQINRLTVYHIKGGVGKTRVAAGLAMEMSILHKIKYGIVSNDEYSVLKNIFKADRLKILKEKEKPPEFPPHIRIIYDLGGRPDSRAVKMLKDSQFVLMPVLPQKEDLQTALDFIQEIRRYNENIIIIANKTKKGDFDKVKAVCSLFYPDLPVFEIKESKVMSLMVEEAKSIRQLVLEHSLHSRYYRQVLEQFEAIIEYMENK